ncbi:MAG: sigma-70 family RNA polymerase sigma factor [Patescibacteria group bacterium]
MTKFITNKEIIKIFEQIDSQKHINVESVTQLQNNIVNKLSFLVYNTVKPYRKFTNYEDLVQEGFIGLIRAVRKFDYRLFPNFFIYSERWIRHSVKRAASKFDIVYCPNRKRVVYTGLSEFNEEVINTTPEDDYISKESYQKINNVLNELPERDREIIEKMFGFGLSDQQTLRSVGNSCNLTHERVRQIKNQVISKLKKNKIMDDLY